MTSSKTHSVSEEIFKSINILKPKKMLYCFGYNFPLSTQLSLLTKPEKIEYSLTSSPVSEMNT